jgi:hypothetical protein
MSVTITVADPLAARLRIEAEQRQVSLDELAARLLAGALEANETDWQDAQRRRLTLLQQSTTSGLNPDESRELQELQAQADRRLELFDRQRLSEVERMEREAGTLLRQG